MSRDKTGLPSVLGALQLGSYRWGSLLASFSPLATVKRRTMIENVAAILAGTFTWQTPAEFRQFIAFNHEAAHFLQDALSGVGHWDYLVQMRHLPKLLGRSAWLATPYEVAPFTAKLAAWEAEATGGDFIASLAETRRSLLDELIMLPWSRWPEERRAALLSELNALAGTPVDGEDYGIETLLEGEAVATVLYQLEQMRGGGNAWAIADDARGLWDPMQMGDRYAEAIGQIYELVRHTTDREAFERMSEKAVTGIVSRFVILFVDLAAAHPSPRLLERTGQSLREFEPGLKFARLQVAFNQMAEEAARPVFEAFFSEDPLRAERALLDEIDFPYIPSTDIYEDWAELLDERAQQTSDPILLVRAECCRARLEHPFDSMLKSLYGALEHETPLLYMSGDVGIHSTLPGRYLVDDDFRGRLVEEVLSHSVALELVDFLFESGRFECPLAEARTCAAARDTCRAIRRLAEFPASDGCSVRANLESQGYPFGVHTAGGPA